METFEPACDASHRMWKIMQRLFILFVVMQTVLSIDVAIGAPEPDPSWVGEAMFPPWHVDKDAPDGLPYFVQAVDGDLLLIGSTNKKWVHHSTVILADRAAAHYTALIAQDQKAWMYHYRGLAHFHLREFDSAIADLDESVRIEPSAAAYNSLGNVRAQLKDFDRAIVDYDKAIELNSKEATFFVNRADAKRFKGDCDAAIEDCTMAIRIAPTNSRGYANRGLAHSDKRDFNQAIADFDEALRCDPNCYISHEARGFVREKTKQYEKAIEDYEAVIRLRPTHFWAYSKLAALLATCPEQQYRDHQRAIELADRGCELTRWQNRMALAQCVGRCVRSG